jgi:OmpA-OmpF porin, OOP family
MSFFRLTAHALLLALLAAPSALAQPRDVKGAGDHPLVGRYDGSVATHYQVKAYEEIRLPARPLERADKDRPAAWTVELAGKLTSIRYEGPAGRSILEVMRNYEAALRAKGFEVKMFCRGEAECSPGRLITTFWEAARGGIGMPSTWDSTVYLLAERDEGGQRTTVGALGVETKASANRPLTPHVALTIVDAKKMETDKIRVIDAGELEKALDRDGRIAIYGIGGADRPARDAPEEEPAPRGPDRRPHRRTGRLRLQPVAVAAPRPGRGRHPGRGPWHRPQAADAGRRRHGRADRDQPHRRRPRQEPPRRDRGARAGALRISAGAACRTCWPAAPPGRRRTSRPAPAPARSGRAPCGWPA